MSHRNQLHHRGGVLKVLVIVFGILALLCAGVGTYVAVSWRGWVAKGIKTVLVPTVQDSSLPQDQKDSIIANLNRVADDFESGKMSKEQFAQIATTLSEGPFFDLVIIESIQANQLSQLELSEEQKAEALMTFDRFQRGIVEEKISQSAREDVMSIVSTDGSNQSPPEPKEELSAEQVQKFLDAMKAKADEAGVAMEKYQVDFAEYVDSAINKVLGTGSDSGGTESGGGDAEGEPAEGEPESGEPAEGEPPAGEPAG